MKSDATSKCERGGQCSLVADANAYGDQKWLKMAQVLGHIGCKEIVLNDDYR